MVNKPKILGTAAETAVVEWLRLNGHPYAERRSLRGTKDQGDVTGIPGVCIEVKVAGRRGLLLGPWLRETEVERVNANAVYGILVAKPTGLGNKRTGKWLAAMYQRQWKRLVREGGWPLNSVPADHVLSGTVVSQLPYRLQNGWNENYGPFMVKAVGRATDPESWYVVGTLEYMNRCLRQAGYGDPEDDLLLRKNHA